MFVLKRVCGGGGDMGLGEGASHMPGRETQSAGGGGVGVPRPTMGLPNCTLLGGARCSTRLSAENDACLPCTFAATADALLSFLYVSRTHIHRTMSVFDMLAHTAAPKHGGVQARVDPRLNLRAARAAFFSSARNL